MYAVIKVGGRQYRATPGEFIDVDRMPYDEGEEVTIEDVLLVRGDDEIAIGRPIVENVRVIATVEEQFRGEKLIVYKYRQRTSYRRRQGHRQYHTRLRINQILVD
jgi:large subunit ribosomal protein L21